MGNDTRETFDLHGRFDALVLRLIEESLVKVRHGGNNDDDVDDDGWV